MDTLQAMRAFVRVVETRNFTRVANEFGTQQSAVSKWITALENHLAVRLLNRNTRRIELTAAGEDYYRRCLTIVAAVDEAEAQVRSDVSCVKGNLHISAPVVLGRLHLLPLLAQFAERYPDIAINITLTDRQVDLVAEGIDLAVRIGQLRDSSLIAKRLGSYSRIVVASPRYIAAHKKIITPKDLLQHNCLLHTLLAEAGRWVFDSDDQQIAIDVSGNLKSNSGDALVQLACDGAGVALLPEWMVAEQLQNGSLLRLLADYVVDTKTVYAIYPHKQHVPVPVRYFLAMLENHFSEYVLS